MTRWREPAPQSSPYISPAGHRRLTAEFKSIWEKRREVTRALAAAAAEGDRSENAEYIYRKKQLREIDRRITYLQRRIPRLQIVNSVESTNRVYFGAEVTVAGQDGAIHRYRIVGADELDAGSDCISIDSPMARALLGKQKGDQARLLLDEREQVYTLLAISYEWQG